MDIAVMLITSHGQGLLGEIAAALDESGEKITFIEAEHYAGRFYIDSLTVSIGGRADIYDNGAHQAPLTAFFHEMVQAWQFLTDNVPQGKTVLSNGEAVMNIELMATGLPLIDENGVSHDIPDPDYPYSENQFREELGFTGRDRYGQNPHGEPIEYIPYEI